MNTIVIIDNIADNMYNAKFKKNNFIMKLYYDNNIVKNYFKVFCNFT